MNWICVKCETHNVGGSECDVCNHARPRVAASKKAPASSPPKRSRPARSSSAKSTATPFSASSVASSKSKAKTKKKSATGLWFAWIFASFSVWFCYQTLQPYFIPNSSESVNSSNFASASITPNRNSYLSSLKTISLLPPAKTTIKRPIAGTWRGEFSGDKAILRIQKRQDNAFYGILTTSDSGGTTQVFFRGVLPDANRIMFKEAKVTRQSSRADWKLGTNSGTFARPDKIQGVGTDGVNPAYKWYFVRVSN